MWVVAEAFALEGITVEYGFFPWARAFPQSTTNDWDGTIEWADTPRHRETHYVSAAYLSKQDWVFFYCQDRPFDWDNIEDLKGKVIGLTIGYAYSDIFDALRQSERAIFDEAPNDELNFRKLLAGRIDIFPIERRVGYTIMAKIFSEEERAKIT
ncbi:substrate-binding periplasmic protein [uncultured Desulfosarcina sp.]|uniref:substrate-binding periplasmic protein n=1 Tax=uncultured Desulfosarcina sp. TaxID=218289 RepID=UPI00374975CF